MKKLFTRFGVEPTFYFNIKSINVPDFLADHFNMTDLLETTSHYIVSKRYKLKLRHKWFKKAYEDGDALEIPSPMYINKKVFLKDYNRLVSFLKTNYDILPSSCVDMETEGGCHLNVSVPKEIQKSTLATTFFKNLQYYLRNNPSIIWSFLAPTDNESSVIPFSSEPRNNNKGNYFTIRKKDAKYLRQSYYGFFNGTPINCDYVGKNRNQMWYIKYEEADRIELRFFMQPRTVEEMSLEIDFGLHLLNWIWQQTLRSKPFTPKNTQPDIRAYANDQPKTLNEIKKVCEEMDFPYQRLVDCGRIENLKTKFLYQDKYFV